MQAGYFGREFGIDKNRQTRDGLNEKFRMFHSAMSSVFAGTPPENDRLFDPVMNLYAKHGLAIRNIFKDINRKAKSSPGLVHNLASSFIHMFISRLFSVNQRYMEMEMYYFVSKYLASVIARQKASNIN